MRPGEFAYGPIREGDVQQGETYDARLEMPGWDTAAFDDAAWQPVTVSAATNRSDRRFALSAGAQTAGNRSGTNDRTQARGVRVSTWGKTSPAGSGSSATASAGTKIVLRHSGMLNPDGTIYTDYLREARAVDTYYPERRRRGGLGAEHHLSRLSVCRSDRVSRQADAGRRHGNCVPFRPADGRHVRVFRCPSQQALQQHPVDAARQSGGHPHGLRGPGGTAGLVRPQPAVPDGVLHDRRAPR